MMKAKNTTPSWHNAIEVLQDSLRSLEYVNDRLKDEVKRKEQFIQKQLTIVRKLTATSKPPVITPKPVPEELFYKIGQKFQYLTEDGRQGHETYILSQIDSSEVNLIGLTSGNRWASSLRVPNTAKIPKSEFDAHFEGPNATEWRVVG